MYLMPNSDSSSEGHWSRLREELLRNQVCVVRMSPRRRWCVHMIASSPHFDLNGHAADDSFTLGVPLDQVEFQLAAALGPRRNFQSQPEG